MRYHKVDMFISSLFLFLPLVDSLQGEPSLSPTLCEDNQLYVSSLGLNCSQHRNTDCKQWVYLGYSNGELERNCPISCNVPCFFNEYPSINPSYFPSINPSTEEYRTIASSSIEIKSVPGLIIGSTRDFFERTTYRLFSKSLIDVEPGAYLEQISIKTQALDDDNVVQLDFSLEFYYDAAIFVQIYSSAISRSFTKEWFEQKLNEFLVSQQYVDELRFHAFFEFCTISPGPSQESYNETNDSGNDNVDKYEINSLLIFALISGSLAAISFFSGFFFRGQQNDSNQKESNESVCSDNGTTANASSFLKSMCFKNKTKTNDVLSSFNCEDNNMADVQVSANRSIPTRGITTENSFNPYEVDTNCRPKHPETHLNDRGCDVPPMITFKNTKIWKGDACNHHEYRDDIPVQCLSNCSQQTKPFSNTTIVNKDELDRNAAPPRIKQRSVNSLSSDQSSEVRSLPTASEIGRRYRHESLYPRSLDIEVRTMQRESSTGMEVLRMKGSPGKVTFGNTHRRGVSFGSNSGLSHKRNDSNSSHSISTSASLAEITRNLDKIESDFIGDCKIIRGGRCNDIFTNNTKGKATRQHSLLRERVLCEDINCSPSLVSDITNASALTNTTKSPRTMKDDFSVGIRSASRSLINASSISPITRLRKMDGQTCPSQKHTQFSNSHKRSKSDDSSKSDKYYYYTFNAPSIGKLGLVIESSKNRGPTVFSVKDYSPLFGMVQPGDVIVKVNDQTTGHMTTSEITKLLDRMRGKRKQKIKLTVVSFYPKAGFQCDSNRYGFENNNFGHQLMNMNEKFNNHVHMMEQTDNH